ncbi:hypothetical protein EI94DRAFT_1805340 [Lactarius quietus]|nr:hypothetical protein EI94DRAFT_1805340 [Lactarius quietus]
MDAELQAVRHVLTVEARLPRGRKKISSMVVIDNNVILEHPTEQPVVSGVNNRYHNLSQAQPNLKTVSFYPGYGGAASILNPDTQHFLDSTFKDPPVEDEEDWINDNQELTPLAQGSTTRMAERPSWELDTIGPTTSATVPHPRDNLRHDGSASSQHSNVSAVTLQPAAESIVALAPSASDAEEEQITKVATMACGH